MVAAFCAMVAMVSYFDRVVLSLDIEPIQNEFDLGDASFGLLMSAFAMGSLVVNGISGILLDHYGVRRMWSIGLLAWAVIMIAQGFVQGFWIFILLRVLLGFGEGMNFLALNRALVDWMRPSELGRAVSFSLIGVPVAMVLGGLVLAPWIFEFGWRWSFVAIGVLAMGMAIGFIIFYRAPEHSKRASSSQPRPSIPIRRVLFDRTLLATGWSFFAFGWVLYFGLTWLPGYLEETWEVRMSSVGLFTTLPWTAAIVLMGLAGWLSDHLKIRTGRTRIARVHVIWICQSIAVFCFIPVSMAGSLTTAIIFLSIGIGFSVAPNSLYYSICADLFPSRAGTAAGAIVTFFSLGGIVSPWVTGWIADSLGGFGPAFTVSCAVVASAVLALVVMARGEREPIEEVEVKGV